MGDSCGRCIHGVISARTAMRLENFATAAHDMVAESWPREAGPGPLHDPRVYLLDYVPVELRLEVSRNFVIGFANCMATMAYLLRQGQMPRPNLIRMTMGVLPGLDKAATAAYLNAGGRPEYAVDAVLGRCEEDLAEAESLGMVFDGELQQRLDALPACTMDDKFEIVRQHLFQSCDIWPCGPYSLADQQYQGDDDWVYYDTSNWAGHKAT